MTLIDEWKRAWRYLSVQIPAWGAMITAVWISMPADVKGNFPGWLTNSFSVAILLATIAGRFVQQPKVKPDGN